MESETVDVDGPVAVRAAGGYALNTRDVQIDLASRTAHSEGPVTGSMPLGTFSADRIAADIGERTVTLEGRARLHIVQNKRSEEHTSELQSLMRISYAVFCLKKQKKHHTMQHMSSTSNRHFKQPSTT